jgi:AcrR family transcriptional regulator
MEIGPGQGEDTKTRLLQAAGEAFARLGFKNATIREICKEAGAHVGAVNYHFRDKEGLYESVFVYSFESAVKKYPPDLDIEPCASPEERLRAFIRSFLLRMMGEGFPAWHGKLMAQEIANPTGLMRQLIQTSIRPLMEYLCGIIKELIRERSETPEETHAIFNCAMSIVGQCLHHFKGKHIIEAICPKGYDPDDIEKITDHITRFSLGGIEAMTKR